MRAGQIGFSKEEYIEKRSHDNWFELTAPRSLRVPTSGASVAMWLMPAITGWRPASAESLFSRRADARRFHLQRSVSV